MVWPAIIAGGSALLGGILGNRSSEQQTETNAQAQRDCPPDPTIPKRTMDCRYFSDRINSGPAPAGFYDAGL